MRVLPRKSPPGYFLILAIQAGNYGAQLSGKGAAMAEKMADKMATQPTGIEPMLIVLCVVMLGLFAALIWALVWGIRDWSRSKPARTSGPIVCPYCSVMVSESVNYLGQVIVCPSCHGQITAPGGFNNAPAEIAGSLTQIGLGAWLLSKLR